MKLREVYLLFTFSITIGCDHFVEGEINYENIKRIHTGMNSKDVITIMGQPYLIDTSKWPDNRFDSIYNYRGKPFADDYIQITFKNDTVKSIFHDF